MNRKIFYAQKCRRLAQCVSKAFQIAHDRWCHSQTLLIVYLAERQVPNTTHKIEEYAYCPLENIFVFPFIYLLVFFYLRYISYVAVMSPRGT